MPLKYCPTCVGKVDSESPFCPHCNKLKPKEGWFPIIVEPTRFKNITVILPKNRKRNILSTFFLTVDNLRKGHIYADWVLPNFYEQLEKQAGKQFEGSNKIKLKSNSTQEIKLNIPYEAEISIYCSWYSSSAEMSLDLDNGSHVLFEEGIYEVTINHYFLKHESYSITKIK